MIDRVCSVVNCDGKHFGRGFCSVHYQRWRRYGDPHVGGPRPTKKPCYVAGCEKTAYIRGLCSMHHERQKKYGDPHRASQKSKTTAERFWEKVDATGDCWEWTGGRSDGYGVFRGAVGEPAGAHRWAWQHLVGEVPLAMQLDHLCRNRGCVNPDHLEVVTQRTNVMRGYGAAARGARCHG